MFYIHLTGSGDQLPIYPHQPRRHLGRIQEFQRAELLKPGQKSEVSLLALGVGTYMAMTENGPQRFHYKISKPGWERDESEEEEKPVFSQSEEDSDDDEGGNK